MLNKGKVTILTKNVHLFGGFFKNIQYICSKGEDTRTKITDAVDDFMKKHNIKLSRKDVSDLVDDITDAAPEVED